MGIMGNTQGVKMEARPKPKATSRNAPRPATAGVLAAPWAAPGATGSAYPAGMATAAATAAESTFNVAVPDHFEGTHIFGLHVWYRAESESSAGPAGASFFNSISTRNATSPS